MSHALKRTAFSTSRLLDFMSEKELVLQCGFGVWDWKLVIVKELIDNSLDACEEQGIAPVIAVTVGADSITVADNGTGIPPETVERLLDFSVRLSSREAYVAPDRGAQGNALKTIVAMPFVMDGERGRVDICGGGVLNEIELRLDRLRQRPKAEITRGNKKGSFVRVHWPVNPDENELHWPVDVTRYLDRSDRRSLQVASGFTFLNPHLTLSIDWFGEQIRFEATDPDWEKWRPSSPTSPHWYRAEDLQRLVAAYLVHDQDAGHDRPVREFVAEFKGLSSTIKQKEVLAMTGMARAPLSSLANAKGDDLDTQKVAGLLAAMQQNTTPVKPRALGTIGEAHMRERFERLGIVEGSFRYARKYTDVTEDGLPQVTESAFAALSKDGDRQFVSGVNWSTSWLNPFRQLGGGYPGQSLDGELAAKFAGSEEPIILLVHVAHPRVQYADRGKSQVLSG